MFNWLWLQIGKLAFWAGRPLLAYYLRRAKRTRVVILNEEHILVTKGWLGTGKWVLPGGGLHAGEDRYEGAIREVREETSVQLRREELNYIAPLQYIQGLFKIEFELFWVKLADRPQVRPQPYEIIAVEWVPLSALNASNSSGDTLAVLAEWQKLR